MNRGLAAALLIVCAAIATASDELDAMFGKDVLIITSEHACHRFDIYVATTDEQRQRGLMFVRDMPETTGMLFVYSGDHPASMWMKNTYISLDIIFALPDGTVSSVIRNTEPLSLRSLASVEPVMFVLELNAGTVDRLGIDETSRLYWEPAHGADE